MRDKVVGSVHLHALDQDQLCANLRLKTVNTQQLLSLNQFISHKKFILTRQNKIHKNSHNILQLCKKQYKTPSLHGEITTK